jgi:hypothetical protein
VIGTQPSGRAPKGSSIGILVSTGYTPPPPQPRPAPAPEPEPEPDEPADPSNGRGGGPPGGGDD